MKRAAILLLCVFALACAKRKKGPAYRAAAIAAAGSTACMAMLDGSVRCWGSGSESTPEIANGFDHAVAVCTGTGYVCARSTSGVTCRWADGKVVTTPGATAVSCESSRRCIVDAAGAITCGDERIAGDAMAIASRGDATCAVLTNHDVRCFGKNADIGIDVSALHGIADVAVGGHHACARSMDQMVWCWGKNDHGQLGEGTTIDRSAPTLVPNLAGILHLAAGSAHTCAHRGDDTIRCWGDDAHHQLGLGTPGGTSLVPTLVPGLYEAVDVAAGDFFTCARMTDGWIRCWGANEQGQIGDGTSLERPVPVPIRM